MQKYTIILALVLGAVTAVAYADAAVSELRRERQATISRQAAKAHCKAGWRYSSYYRHCVRILPYPLSG
jgi:hypothetical protein